MNKKQIKNNEQMTDLMHAAKNGHLETVEKLICDGVKDSIVNIHGMTALLYAAENSHLEIIKILIAKWRAQHSNINYVNHINGMTTLMYAAENGNLEIIEYIKNYYDDIDLNYHNHINGMTAIMYAAKRGHLKVVKFFVENDAHIEYEWKHDKLKRCKNNWSALMIAVRYKHIDMMKYLVENNAELNIKCNLDETAYDMTPLIYAADNGLFEIVKYLVEKGALLDIKSKSNSDETALFKAVKSHHYDIAKFLIENGADVNVNNFYKTNMLLLVNEKRDSGFNGYNGNDYKPYIKARNKIFQIIKLLVENGADINASDRYGDTVLIYAIQDLHFDIIKYLIQNGADIHHVNKKGKTPLMVAVDNSPFEFPNVKYSNDKLMVIKLLIEHGADINASNPYNGETLIEQVDIRYVDIIKYLIENGANTQYIGPILNSLVKDGNLEMVKYLVEHEGDKFQVTALNVAVKYGNLEMVKYIVENNIKHIFNNIDINIRSLLQTASKLEYTDIYTYLLNKKFEKSVIWEHERCDSILHKWSPELRQELLNKRLNDENLKTIFVKGKCYGTSPFSDECDNIYRRWRKSKLHCISGKKWTPLEYSNFYNKCKIDFGIDTFQNMLMLDDIQNAYHVNYLIKTPDDISNRKWNDIVKMHVK